MDSPRTLCFLVRHAVTDATGKVLYGRLPGFSLSDEGVRQARSTASVLGEFEFDAIYTSPLERARETAVEIAKSQTVELIDDNEILECDCGDLAGKTFEELRSLDVWKRALDSPFDTMFPNGESIAAMSQRMVARLGTLRSVHEGGRFCVVTHRDLIQSAIADFVGVPLGRHERIEVGPASVSVLEWTGDEKRLLCVNQAGKLSEIVNG